MLVAAVADWPMPVLSLVGHEMGFSNYRLSHTQAKVTRGKKPAPASAEEGDGADFGD